MPKGIPNKPKLTSSLVWETAWAYNACSDAGQDQAKMMMDDGWEPFAVDGNILWFRKQFST